MAVKMQLYNLEYRYLDSMGRTKNTSHGGVFSDLNKIEDFKSNLLAREKKKKIAFDVYIMDKPLFS